MSVKIHHGPSGSYKTSGAIQDDFIPAARAGRVIVTNVRGLNDRAKIFEVLGDLPESFEIHYFPTSDHIDAAKNRENFARFFHWLPFGALFLVDEAQMIFPKHWTAKDIAKLNYPGGIDEASKDGRPSDLWIAFDMHRHYNWDIILTTTNISKIREDIRNVADMAYRHRNMATIGIKGRYFETQHQPEDNGAAEANQIQTRSRKIDPIVWKLYESTATGEISDTKAGLSFYKSPKVVLLLLVLSGIVLFVGTHWGNLGPRTKPVADTPANVAPGVRPGAPGAVASAVVSDSPPSSGHTDNVRVVQVGAFAVVEPYHDYKIRVSSSIAVDHGDYVQRLVNFEMTRQDEIIKVSSSELASLGYSVQYLSPCLVRLVYQGVVHVANCLKPKKLQQSVPLLGTGLRASADDVGGSAGALGQSLGVLPNQLPSADSDN